MNTPLKSLWLFAISTLVLSCNGTDQSSNNDIQDEKKRAESMTTTSMDKAPKMPKSKDIYTQAAIETCECVQPWLEKAKQLNEFESSKQHSDMKKMASEMHEIQPQIQKCSEAIQNKYTKRNMIIDEKKIMQAVMTQCPDIVTVFSTIANTQ